MENGGRRGPSVHTETIACLQCEEQAGGNAHGQTAEITTVLWAKEAGSLK